MLAFHPCTFIVSGGASGADTLAVKFAKENNISYREHLPNWELHGKSAGFIRNKLIIKDADEVVVFWDGKSPGSASSIKLAEQAGKPVYIYWPTEEDFLGDIG
jgi:predicted Rossmann fold nucleotide-binding protein DprA/Smf involved in DNA uptake